MTRCKLTMPFYSLVSGSLIFPRDFDRVVDALIGKKPDPFLDKNSRNLVCISILRQ